jgi:hypothetical protein
MRSLVGALMITCALGFQLKNSVAPRLGKALSLIPDASHIDIIQTHTAALGAFDWTHLTQHSFFTSDAAADAVTDAATAVSSSPYSKVDKTGPIGFFADTIEQAIDLTSQTFKNLGLANGYGFAIILFTILSKKFVSE